MQEFLCFWPEIILQTEVAKGAGLDRCTALVITGPGSPLTHSQAGKVPGGSISTVSPHDRSCPRVVSSEKRSDREYNDEEEKTHASIATEKVNDQG